MERALYWVRQLDAKTDMMANVHVYNVENYKAKNLADILTQVYGGTARPPPSRNPSPRWASSPGAPLLAVPAAPPVAWVAAWAAMGGSQQQGGMGGTVSGGLDLAGAGGAGGLGGAAGGVPGGQTGGSPLKERATGGGAEGTSLKEGVRVIPDEENNLLVVVAPPYEWNIISRILKELDIMPRQVLNEVLIAEVTLTDELKYGIELLIGATPVTSATSTATGNTLPAPAASWWPANKERRRILPVLPVKLVLFHRVRPPPSPERCRGPVRPSPPPGVLPSWPWTPRTSSEASSTCWLPKARWKSWPRPRSWRPTTRKPAF